MAAAVVAAAPGGGGARGVGLGAPAGEQGEEDDAFPWPGLQLDSVASEASEGEEPLTPTTVRRRSGANEESSYRLLGEGEDTERYLPVSVFTQGLPPRSPSEHVLDGIPDCGCGLGAFCVVFHAVAGIAFTGRAYDFWLQRTRSFCMFEAALAALLSSLYMIIGVWMPCRVAHLQDERPLRRILTVRSCYPKDEQIREFIRHAQWLWRLATLFGLAAPSLSILQLQIDRPGPDGLYENVFLSVAIIVCLTCWMLGLLLFGPGKLEEVALDAAKVSVAGFIDELEGISQRCAEGAPLHGSREILWATMSKKYVSLDRVLETLWGLDCIGGLWATRIGTLFVCSVIFAAVGLKHPDIPTRWAFRVCGFILALGGVFLLVRLAQFSGMCQGSALAEKSLPSAVKRLAAELPVPSRHERSSADSFAQLHDLTFFQNFLVLVLENKMGAQVFVTYELVASTALKMCVYVPVLFATIGEWCFRGT